MNGLSTGRLSCRLRLLLCFAALTLFAGCEASAPIRWGVLAPAGGMTVGGKVGVVVRFSEKMVGKSFPVRVEYALGDLRWTDPAPRRHHPNSVWTVDTTGLNGNQTIVVTIVGRDGKKTVLDRGVSVMAPEIVPGPAKFLVVAPHPDDAVLCCAGVIKSAIDRGAEVHVVMMTNNDFWETGPKAWRRQGLARDYDGDGDTDMVDYGYANVEESRAAMAFLGVPLANVVHLGYPEGALSEMWEARDGTPQSPPLARDIEASPYTLDELASYRWMLDRRRAAFTHAAVVEDLAAILRAVRPDVIFVSHPDDTHPTHWATNYFVAEAAAASGLQTPLATYLIHWGLLGDYPSEGYGYTPPKAGNSAEFAFPEMVSIAGLRASIKRQAMDLYPTQFIISAEISTYLHYFAKDQEPFWPMWPLLPKSGQFTATAVVADGKTVPQILQIPVVAGLPQILEIDGAAEVTVLTQAEAPRRAGDVMGFESIRKGSLPTPERFLERHVLAAGKRQLTLEAPVPADGLPGWIPEWIYVRLESMQPFSVRRIEAPGASGAASAGHP